MPLSEVKVQLHCHMLLLTQRLSAEEPTQVIFWWLHDVFQVSSTLSTRHWTGLCSPIQGCSPVFRPADFELALAPHRAVLLYVLAHNSSAAGHYQCCKQTITLMPRRFQRGGPQPATPSLSQGTPTQQAQLLLFLKLTFTTTDVKTETQMQHINHAYTTPNSQNINNMLPFYQDISHFNCLTQWSSGYPLKLLDTLVKYLMTPVALTGEPILQYFPSYHEGSMSFSPQPTARHSFNFFGSLQNNTFK